MGRKRLKLEMSVQESNLLDSVNGNSNEIIKKTLTKPEILAAVFGYCDPNTLAKCRLVSTLWYEVSMEQWKSTACLCVNAKKGGRLPSNLMELAENRTRRVFGRGETSAVKLGDIQNLKTYPYRRCRVVKGLSTRLEGNQFWNEVGSSLHELTLESSHFINYNCWRSIVFCKTPNLRKLVLLEYSPHWRMTKEEDKIMLPYSATQLNLTSLEVQTMNGKDWRGFEIPVHWRTLLSFFPKLEKITLPIFSKTLFDVDEEIESEFVERKLWINSCQSFNSFLEVVGDIRSSDLSKLAIKYLNGIPSMNQSIHWAEASFTLSSVNQFKYANLPLQTLMLEIGHIEEPILQQLISLYVGTLQTLVLQRGVVNRRRRSFYHLFTEQMASLEVLELEGLLAHDMSFLRFTPNLRKLFINGRGWREKHRKSCEATNNKFTKEEQLLETFRSTIDMVEGAKKVNNEAKLKLAHLVEFKSYFKFEKSSTVKLLRKWFPNLEVLRAHVNSSSLCQIFKCWENTLKQVVLRRGSYIKKNKRLSTELSIRNVPMAK